MIFLLMSLCVCVSFCVCFQICNGMCRGQETARSGSFFAFVPSGLAASVFSC